MFNMRLQLYIAFFILLITLSILYNKITTYNDSEAEESGLNMQRNLEKNKNPILWVHIPYELNSRSWESFGSRNTYDLGQPYLAHTVRSIIKNGTNDFNVYLIDDNSFKKLLPEWTIDLKTLQEPSRENVRNLAIAKLVYKYGGMVVPISFLAMEPLIHLYARGIKNGGMFMCEAPSRLLNRVELPFTPSIEFMGAEKNSDDISKLISYLQVKISTDNTIDSKFVGGAGEYMKQYATIVDGMYVGTKTLDKRPVLVDDLLADNYINFYDEMFGIWIPRREILNRTKYDWFAVMTEEQIYNGTFILSKYFTITK